MYNSKLKYVCNAFSANISTDLLSDDTTLFKVYGASGLVGYYKFKVMSHEYLGIIKDGAGVGRIDIYPENSSLLGTMTYIVPKKGIDLHYLKYTISALRLEESIDKTTIPHIYFSEYGNRKIYMPSLQEQQKVANYLDQKCSEIDSVMADLQEQIDKLEQYKRSVISETVTNGLNPKATMKNSGIGWVGMIPNSWKVDRISSLYRLRNTKVNDRDYSPLSVTMKGILPQLETAAKTNAHEDRKLVRIGDFAINSRSDRRGSCGVSQYDGSVSLINTVLQPLSNMIPGYYNWLFHTIEFADEFYKWGHGIVNDLWTTGWQEMRNIKIIVPSLQEQQEISDYLDKKCAEIESIIEDKKRQLEVVENYKKSLIYEYVTGKKEVSDE